jgi:hypothetical protein
VLSTDQAPVGTAGEQRSTLHSRVAGLSLIGAASLFLVAWALMPAPGVTDAQLILDLVAGQRGAVAASAVIQLASAVLYGVAATALLRDADPGLRARLWAPLTVVVVGLLGSVADAVIHLLAYAMTAPGLDKGSLVVVMAFMQGPALLLVAPLIAAFFVGGAWLSVVLAREGVVSRWNPRLYAIALAVGVVAALLARVGGVESRWLGVLAITLVCAAHKWCGAVVGRRPR